MIFIGMCAVLVLAIAFAHYIQGFFSATLSAILAILAAVLAFSWHETIVETVLKGRMLNNGHSVVLLALFCLIYVILRVIFDKAIPAGIRLPAIVDKAGAGVMGLVAAAFAVGIFAIAAQEMPFDQAPGGYARYTVQNRHVYLRRHGKGLDSETVEELQSNELGKFDEADRHSAFVDDIVISTTRYLSEQGSLQGSQKLTAVHPDYIQELFAQRLGTQPGANRVSSNLPGASPAMTIASIWQLSSVQLQDLYPDKLRDSAAHSKWTGTLTNNGTPTAPSGPRVDKDQIIVGVRMVFNRVAADRADNQVRFSPGTIRLASTKKDESGQMQPTNYFPWGTLEKGNTVYLSKPDDFLFASLAEGEAHAVDLMFVVDKEGFLAPDSKPGNSRIADGVFIEFKRLARESLSGEPVLSAPKPLAGIPIGIMHPEIEQTYFPPMVPVSSPANPTPQPQTQPQPSRPAPNAARGSMTSAQQNVAAIGGKMFNFSGILKSNLLPTPIAFPSADLTKPAISIDATGVDATLEDKKIRSLNVNPKVSVAQLGTGDFKTRELAVPARMTLIQITSNQPSEPGVWAQKASLFRLVVSDNRRLAANGIWAMFKEGNEDRLLARYSMEYEISEVTPLPGGQPSQITLAFLVPQGVTLKQLLLDDQVVKDLTQEPVATAP